MSSPPREIGIKSAQIFNLAKDLARGLSVISVRVVEVIPGKPTIGLEIPNAIRQVVYLSEILQSEAYDRSSSPIRRDYTSDPELRLNIGA